ncbi:MAG: FUSC family protein [Solirubrobacteraceae bacterium]
MQARISGRLRDPLMWAEASQLAKTVGAAVVAWVLAVHVFHLSQAFMAPWAALLTVHATVFGTLQRAAQQAGASVLGVLIAAGASQLFGASALALGATVVAGMLAGGVPGLRAPMTTATTAVVVLTTGYVGRGGMLADRLIDTGIGIAVGLLVNLLVWPPLRDRAAARHIDVIDDRLGELLTKIAGALGEGCATEAADDWIVHTRRLDGGIDRAWHVLEEARQSGRLNPRRAVPARMRAAEEMTQVINRLAQAVAEIRSMARTIRVARIGPADWDPGFREPWVGLLERAGAAVERADADALRSARAELTELSDRLTGAQLHGGQWPMFGALLVNLRNVLDALDVVAEAQPVQVRAPALGGGGRAGA